MSDKSAVQFAASEDDDNPTIIDGLQKHLITVGVNVGAPAFVVGGAAVVEDAGPVVRIASVSDNDGHAPTVYVDWPGEGVEGYMCGVRDYRQEGPSGPYVYVCDDLVVVVEEVDAGEQAEQNTALADAERDRRAEQDVAALREGVTSPSRLQDGDA
jgi:hypothetical protein